MIHIDHAKDFGVNVRHWVRMKEHRMKEQGMIIVTGGAGFIGWHLCQFLLSWGSKVVCVDDLRASVVEEPELRALQSANLNFRFWKCSDQEMQQKLHPNDHVEAVFHLASPVGPVGVLEDAGDIASQIVRGACAAADVAVGWGCRLVFVSTSEVYGGSPHALDEDDTCMFPPGHSARKEYALGKLAAECALQNIQSDLDVVIIRPFNVAGPRQNAAKGFVIPRFVQQALDGEELTVFGNGSDRRAMTHVLDVVDGLWSAYLRGVRGEVYNLGNRANVTSMVNLAKMVALHPLSKSQGYHMVNPENLFPGYVSAPEKFPDQSKAQAQLAWYPSRALTTVVDDAFQWEVTVRGMKTP